MSRITGNTIDDFGNDDDDQKVSGVWFRLLHFHGEDICVQRWEVISFTLRCSEPTRNDTLFCYTHWFLQSKAFKIVRTTSAMQMSCCFIWRRCGRWLKLVYSARRLETFCVTYDHDRDIERHFYITWSDEVDDAVYLFQWRDAPNCLR